MTGRVAACPTFTQDVHGVPRLQVQVLRPLGTVAMLGHRLVEDRPAAYSLWQRGRCTASRHQRLWDAALWPPRPRPHHPQTHSALELQPGGARTRIPPGPLQGLLLGEGDPVPVTRVSVTAKRFISLGREGL